MLEWVTHILNTLPLQCNPGSYTSSGITANLPQDGTLHRQYNSEFYNVIISSFITGNTFLQNIFIIWNVLSRISASCAFIVESYTFVQVTHILGYVQAIGTQFQVAHKWLSVYLATNNPNLNSRQW